MRYRFDKFVVDTERYAVFKQGQSLRAQPKVFEVLRHLIEHRDRVVSKRELLAALWSEQQEDEFVVAWSVSHLRRLLGQRKGTQAPIRTVHLRGYRFAAEVEVLESKSDLAQHPAEKQASASEASRSDPFVGREHLMQQLDLRLTQIMAGQGTGCLLVGEAGIGKTRCIDELSTRAAARGIDVLAGRSVESTFGPVFWPWIQILRALTERHPELAETTEALVTRLVASSQVANETTARSPSRGGPSESDRFWHYDTLTTLLQRAAKQRPILLAFDDLHWADAGTWELLAFFASELRRSPIMLIGAKREDSRASNRDPGAHNVRDLHRLELSPLSANDVEQYLKLVSGVAQPNAALSEAIQTSSLGNPWFVRETVHALSTRHGARALATLEASAVVPSGRAIDVLRTRLAALPSATRTLLSIASVLGQHFELDLLARVSRLPVEQVLSALDLSREAGMVTLEPAHRAHFCHGMVQSLLYEELPSSERLELHHRAALALDETRDPLQYGEIAHHYHRSLPLQDYGRAAEAAVRAAEAASRAHAFGDAALFLEWATLAQQKDARVEPRPRAELLLRLALTERRAGRELAARTSATRAIELGRQHGDYDIVVRATRILRFSYALGYVPDPLALSALNETLERCPPYACEERVGALSLLSFLPPHALDMERSKALSAQAVALAKELDRPSALREALHARLYALSGPDDIDAQVAAAEALLAVPGNRPSWVLLEALLASYRAHLYRCDLVAADAALSALGRQGSELGLTEVVWYHDFFRAQHVFARGDFAGSEQLFTDLATRGARFRLPQAPLLCRGAKSLLTRARGGAPALREGEGPEAWLSELFALPPGYAASGARFAAEVGQLARAKRLFHELARNDFAALLKDLTYVSALANLGEVAAILDERQHAQALYERLVPYAQHNTPSGAIGFFEGPASRFLARLAAYLGDDVHAELHFEQALAQNEQLGLLPLVARTCCDYASWQKNRGRGAGALPLKRRAIDLAVRLGMQNLATKARDL